MGAELDKEKTIAGRLSGKNAHVALFLASDESSFMTGAELVVHGGCSCP
jgi:NAD(P)-dependent dehydrogenase (short-subunit alcohol dehydrogenase family)